jgi:uncharacterized protein (DUF1778 family)
VAMEGCPLHQVRPDARLLDEERKLLTHAIGDGRLQRRCPPWPGCCARTTLRADDEARALIRKAFTLAGDLG